MRPAIAGRISYPAGLSTAHSRLHTGMKMGYEGKFQAAYEPIHWAGTESANYWQGYLYGAVTAGYRTATEVAAALG